MTVSTAALCALAAAIALVVPLYAWRARGRGYATFGLVTLAIAFPAALVLHARLRATLPAPAGPALDALWAWGLVATAVHLASLVRARLRGCAFRWLVSLPASAFLAMGALALVWLAALLPLRAALWLAGQEGALAWLRWLDLVPLVVAGVSLATSLRPVEEVVRIPMALAARAAHAPEQLTRLAVERHRRRSPAPLPTRPLRVVQVTDPHLGPFQPVHRLRAHLERLLAREPDLVLLTGDFLTMEGGGTPGALARALEPLRPFEGRSFAVFGNHDHEAPEEVRAALAETRVQLLDDEEATVQTPVGTVQILGADHVFRGSRERLATLFERHPRRDGALRLLLLHDPGRFRHVPPGEVDLTLSGHTHGGQLGLVSLGLGWTVLARSRWPDHGLFARGTSRLYVHRGTGHYGFPLRVGVPGEASLLELLVD